MMLKACQDNNEFWRLLHFFVNQPIVKKLSEPQITLIALIKAGKGVALTRFKRLQYRLSS